MAQITPWVRQYSLRDLLDASFDLFKARAVTLTLAGLLPYLLVILYVGVIRLFVLPGMFQLFSLQTASSVDFSTVFNNPSYVFFLLGLMLLELFTSGAGYIAQCRVAVRHALGEDTSIPRAFRLLAKPLFSLFVVGLLWYAFCMAVCMVAMFILGFLFLIATALLGVGAMSASNVGTQGLITIGSLILPLLGFIAVELVMLAVSLASVFFLSAPVALAGEHVGPFTAIGKSFRFAQCNFRAHLFAFYILLHAMLAYGAMLYIGLSLLQSLGTGISPTITTMAISVLFGMGLKALCGMFAGLQSLVYLDGRCRTEEFDLTLLAGAIGMGDAFAQSITPQSAALQPAYPDYSAHPASRAVLATPAAAMPFPNYSAPPPAGEPREDVDARA